MDSAAFWKNVGKGFASVAKYAGKAALWASQHPEVIAIIGAAAHVPPGAAKAISVGLQVAGAVDSSVESSR
jgi:hypothetical protein